VATNGGSVRCAGAMLGQHRHICAFFNSFDEQHRVLRSFIKEGFERGDKAFHIVDPELQGEHLKRLAEAGIDVEQAMGTGQLELRRWQDAYMRDDRFDQDAMLALLEQVLRSGAASGYPLTRFVSRVDPISAGSRRCRPKPPDSSAPPGRSPANRTARARPPAAA
jgi:hypothetical protein